MQLYLIRKVTKKGMRQVGYLSGGKRRWLSRNTRHRLLQVNEQDADLLLQSLAKKDSSGVYYFFKVMA